MRVRRRDGALRHGHDLVARADAIACERHFSDHRLAADFDHAQRPDLGIDLARRLDDVGAVIDHFPEVRVDVLNPLEQVNALRALIASNKVNRGVIAPDNRVGLVAEIPGKTQQAKGPAVEALDGLEIGAEGDSTGGRPIGMLAGDPDHERTDVLLWISPENFELSRRVGEHRRAWFELPFTDGDLSMDYGRLAKPSDKIGCRRTEIGRRSAVQDAASRLGVRRHGRGDERKGSRLHPRH